MSCSAPDIISNLPDDILENILERIPLKDAVRTSILSKRWMYSWTTLQQLVFDDTLWEDLSFNQKQNKILLIIFQVRYRIQKIRKFLLSCRPFKSCPEIDNLIMGLPSTQIEEFTLHICGGMPHKLPLCLFSYQELSHLDLSNCVFSPPANFRGFSLVISLELVNVSITGDSLMSLVSRCPLLEKLKLILRSEISYGFIMIDNPSLKYLILGGIFQSVSLRNATSLSTVSLCGMQVQKNDMSTSFFSNFVALQNLEMDGKSMMSFITGWEPPNSILANVKILKLVDICLPSCLTLPQFLSASLNLQILKIRLSSSGEDYRGLSNFQIWQNLYFNKLRDVHVDCYSGTRTEIVFIEYILTRSPVLENVIIKKAPEKVGSGLTISKELLSCHRLSPKAKICV